jgi:4-hydroxybenzoate polyprenyltransferase
VAAIRLLVMMVRPPVAFVLMLFAAIGMAQAGSGDAVHPFLTTVLVVIAGWFVNATVLNDLSDEAIDRVNLQNAPGRPLVSGHATRHQLLVLGTATGAVALVTAFAVDWRIGAIVTIGLALNAAYSLPPIRLSQRGAVASLLLPLGYVALPFLVGALTVRPRITGSQLVLLAGLYVTFIGRILLKDFRDVRGDAQFGKLTFLLRHGRTATCLASAACWIAGTACLLALVPARSLLVVAFALYLGCALHGLRRLQEASSYTAEQVMIGAIASVGRGMAITLLAHFTMLHKGWTPLSRAVVTTALALLFVWTYSALASKRHAPVAVRPY